MVEHTHHSASEHRRPALGRTLGYVIKHDAQGIQLAAERMESPADIDVGYRGRSFIPAGIVVKVRKLK